MDTQSGRNRANPVARYGPTLLLLAVVVLTGSKCVVSFNSGRSSDDEDKDHVDKHHTGRFIDAPVDGVRFVAGALSGRTGPNGEYRYETAGSVAFFIGDVALGQAAPGQELITPLDLVPGGTLDTTAVINIARLLQSLDAVRGDAKITIPADVHDLAVVSNDAVAAAIEFLDFADETAFVNAASQLVSVLTQSYPHSASLVDADTARRHLSEQLAASGIEP